MEACNVWTINACIQGLCVICPEPIQTFHIGLCSLCLMQSEMVNSMEKLCSIAYNFLTIIHLIHVPNEEKSLIQ